MSVSTLNFTKNSFVSHFLRKQREHNIRKNTNCRKKEKLKIPSLAQTSLEEEMKPEEHPAISTIFSFNGYYLKLKRMRKVSLWEKRILICGFWFLIFDFRSFKETEEKDKAYTGRRCRYQVQCSALLRYAKVGCMRLCKSSVFFFNITF